MTTQTSQPNGDGQMLRGAQALRAAARNALTARGHAEPVDPADSAELSGAPAEPARPVGPVAATAPVASVAPGEAEAPVAPAPVAPAGWNESGWYQNVRLLSGPPAEAGPPHEGEPPGPVATAARPDAFAKQPAETELSVGRDHGQVGEHAPEHAAGRAPESMPSGEPEPEHGFAAGPEACYGGTAPEVADIVEWASAEKERERPPEFVSLELPTETGTSLSTATTEAPVEQRVAAGGLLESPEIVTEYSAPTTYAMPVVEPAPGDSDVPQARGGSWRMPPSEERSERETDMGEASPEAEPGHEAAAESVGNENGTGTGDADAAVATGADDDPSDSAAATSSGIPAPVWNVTVPAGSGSVVPTRAALTFDSQRWSPLIVGEATHEIPVHLLFRDEGSATAPTAGRPQLRRGPAVATPPAPAVLDPAASSRPATPVDTKLVERPGPTLPGWTAALVGFAGLFGCAAVLWWVGAIPEALTEMFGLDSNPYNGIGIGKWALLALAVTLTLFAFGGLGRGRVGHAWVLTLFGEYRGSVRRTGLLWVSPLLLRRRVDVRLRHWRSEPMPAVDANGTELRVVVLVVWRVRDTVRAALGVRDHEEYLREQVEAAMARVLSQLPADAFNEAAPTLRNAELVGEALTRMLSAECRPVGLDVFSAQPTRIEYAPEISAAMQRSRIAAIDARHRDSVLTSVVDAVDDTVHRLTSRGLVELDDYERKVLVKDLTVAFYTGRHGLNERS
ncbi:SPFH domain-containing protein [Streptomyces sp. NPDC058653]|uniref:SPFH domain-containing protein n=1 Tax=Streptomyces sp. NPDC058653 TaxID=3346576 RepID=UPI003655A654